MLRERKPLRVILDSNALFVPSQFKIDIFEGLRNIFGKGFEAIVFPQILKEVEKIAKGGSPKMRKEARCAIEVAEKCRLIEPNDGSAGTADDVIVQMALKWRCPVFTNDRELKRRLRDINVPVIYVRQKSRLEIDGRV